MCKVYLYSRVSTSAQTLAQQERTVYEWLNNHNMTVGEIISDEGVSGGVSYKDRNLGKILLPKLVEGDMIIVSEISRLGRSMFDLSKLIHTELKPRKVRLVVCNMGIDLNCAKMTAIDELILSNFSFAAQLEKQLISERTLSALAVKKKQGVLLGAASPKYKMAMSLKSDKLKQEEIMERGKLRTQHYKENRDVIAFEKVIRRVFPDSAKKKDIKLWDWDSISCRKFYRERMKEVMLEYIELDGTGKLFCKWNFDDDEVFRHKLSSYMQTFRRVMTC